MSVMAVSSIAEKSAIIEQVQSELTQGNLVVLLGGPCSGKSWLINRIFENESVLDKSVYELKGEQARLHKRALESWMEGSKSAIAVDEVQLFDTAELVYIIESASARQKGVVIAAQRSSHLIDQAVIAFLNAQQQAGLSNLQRQVVVVEMGPWIQDKGLGQCRVRKVGAHSQYLTRSGEQYDTLAS